MCLSYQVSFLFVFKGLPSSSPSYGFTTGVVNMASKINPTKGEDRVQRGCVPGQGHTVTPWQTPGCGETSPPLLAPSLGGSLLDKGTMAYELGI